MSRAQIGISAGVAGAAAVSAYLSLGSIALSGQGEAGRVLALPPIWLLAALVGIALALALYLRPAPGAIAPLAITVVLWLPFLPGDVPAAAFMWQGPIEIGVWVIAAAGVIASRRASIPVTAAPWLAMLGAALAFTIGALALHQRLPLGDEPHYLMMTQSLIKDGDLRIENNHRNRDYAAFYPIDILPHYVQRGADGQIYSVHAPGVSVLVLPAFAVFGYAGAVATLIVVVALASGIAWQAAWLLTGEAAAAWITWAAIFLTAPVYQQAFTVFPDGAGVLPVIVTVWLLIALERRRPVSTAMLIICGVALATMPWLHTRFALLVAGLGIAAALRLFHERWTRAATYLAVPAVSTLLWLGFFWLIWGTPDPRAPWGAVTGSRPEWIGRGLTGLLLDQRAGILLTAPIYLCAMAGWLVMAKAHRRLAIETVLIATVLAASVASYDTWWGGQGAPGRYIVAMLPVLAVPMAAFAASPAWWARPAAMSALIASMLMLVARVFAADGALAYVPEAGLNPLLAWLAPGVALSEALPQLARVEDLHYLATAAGPAWAIAARWGAAALAIGTVVAVAMRTMRPRASLAYAAIVWSAALAVMIGATAVWHSRGITGLSPLGSQLNFVTQWTSMLHVTDPAHINLRVPATGAVAPALRAQTLGDAQVFFLDDAAYPEPTGFWVEAHRRATTIIDLSDPARSLGLRLQAGPVPTAIDLVINGAPQHVTLGPRERHETVIPPAAAGAWKITIRPEAGFRPEDFDPRVKDARNLGVWIEVF